MKYIGANVHTRICTYTYKTAHTHTSYIYALTHITHTYIYIYIYVTHEYEGTNSRHTILPNDTTLLSSFALLEIQKCLVCFISLNVEEKESEDSQRMLKVEATDLFFFIKD